MAVESGDMDAALEGFSPASSWGVGRVSAGEGPGPRGWQDVGGLEDVREALQETLELPTRYAKLIARWRCSLLMLLSVFALFSLLPTPWAPNLSSASMHGQVP